MYKKLIFLVTFMLVIMFIINDSPFVFAKDETVDEWLQSEQKERDKTPTAPLNESEEEQENQLSFPFLRMFAALAFIIILIYALAKFLNKRTRAFHGSRLLESLGGISVGQNRSIQIIKVGKRLFVIGVSDSIQLLKEITDENEIQQFIQERERALEQDDLISKSKQWLQKKQPLKTENFSTILDKQFKKIIEERKKIYSNVKKKESRDE